ncbi:DUF4013 domain-containing protein [Methanobrevibacter sp.]
MPIDILKGSFKYCTKNIWFFLFVITLIVIFQIITEAEFLHPFGSIIYIIVLEGYGLQVIEDVSNGGERLPKIMPKKIIMYGVKGFIIQLFYLSIQGFLLSSIALNLNFPEFEIEELLLNFPEFINLLYSHDFGTFLIFVISGFIIVFFTVFFMEIALARLANGGQLRQAFNFPRIKHVIDIIGWKKYAIGYSKIIFSVVILLFINNHLMNDDIISLLISFLISVLIFVIEYRGMGSVYKVYLENKT